MDLYKFAEFLNEVVMIPVLDCVIDDFGNVYNGFVPEFPLRKGNIEKEKDGVVKIAGIIGYDSKRYIAGIDKNGKLVAADKNKLNGYLVDDSGNRIKIPNYIKSVKSIYWKFNDIKLVDGSEVIGDDYDYSKLIPILPTGWVNTKVDMEVVKKVRRYSRGLGSGRGIEGFILKITELEKLSQGLEKRKRSRQTIQKEMSAIMLLHYINEIKDFFTPSASGFLFESFLGGMIKNAKIIEDNSKADIMADGESWQIKLYDGISTSSISVAYMPDGSPVDHFVISLKYADRIEITTLKGIDDKSEPLCYLNYLTTGGNFSISKIKSCPFRRIINLTGIEERIETIAEGLKQSIDDVYSDLSKFQYNIESIITGVDERGKILTENKFDDVYNDSLSIARELDKKITSLYISIKNE